MSEATARQRLDAPRTSRRFTPQFDVEAAVHVVDTDG